MWRRKRGKLLPVVKSMRGYACPVLLLVARRACVREGGGKEETDEVGAGGGLSRLEEGEEREREDHERRGTRTRHGRRGVYVRAQAVCGAKITKSIEQVERSGGSFGSGSHEPCYRHVRGVFDGGRAGPRGRP